MGNRVRVAAVIRHVHRALQQEMLRSRPFVTSYASRNCNILPYYSTFKNIHHFYRKKNKKKKRRDIFFSS